MKIVSEKHFSVKIGTSLVSLFSFQNESNMMMVIQDAESVPITIASYRNSDEIEIFNKNTDLPSFISISKINLENLENIHDFIGKVISDLKANI